MSWVAIADHDGHKVAAGLPDVPLPRGSLVIETRLPTGNRPLPLVYFDHGGAQPFHLSLQSIPSGGLTLVLGQGGETLHRTISHSETGRADLLRLTYTWDTDAGRAQLALDRSDQDGVILMPLETARPMRADDIRALFLDQSRLYLAPAVGFIALSTDKAPVGPMPTLAPATPIATPNGYRRAGDLRRGDTVLTPGGDIVPVLHTVTQTVPARGSFRPVRLRAPYFGLKRDITVAPSQRLVVTGSDVEYLFNQEAVLVEVRHLVGGTAVLPAKCGTLVSYTQLILPAHEAVNAAGAMAETLYVGRLRRKPAELQASTLNGIDRQMLPEHGKSLYPVLRAFDAVVLAEQRAA